MTKNERSLQWVIAGIFFVVCFAFFQWIYPNHLFFKEQMSKGGKTKCDK